MLFGLYLTAHPLCKLPPGETLDAVKKATVVLTHGLAVMVRTLSGPEIYWCQNGWSAVSIVVLSG